MIFKQLAKVAILFFRMRPCILCANLMIFKQLAKVAILFFRMRPKFVRGKRIAGHDFPWAVFFNILKP